MQLLSTHLISFGCLFLIACLQLSDAAEPGYLDGHLKIASRKEVELADAGPSKHTEQNYQDYPLVILSKAGQKEIARVTPDQEGNFHVSLPPGDYIIDVEGRESSRVRAKPQAFTIVSGQTVHLDLDVATGIR